MATIGDIPEEILVEIFRGLTFEEIRTIKQVSRTWKRISEDVVCIFHADGSVITEVPRNVSVERLTHLALRSCVISDEILAHIALGAPNLRVVYLQNCMALTNRGVTPFLQLPELRVLTIVGCGEIASRDLRGEGERGPKITIVPGRRGRDLHPGLTILLRAHGSGGKDVYGKLIATPNNTDEIVEVNAVSCVKCVKTGKRYDVVLPYDDFVPTYLRTETGYLCLHAMNDEGDCCDFELVMDGFIVERKLMGPPSELRLLRNRLMKGRPEDTDVHARVLRIYGDPAWYLCGSSFVTSERLEEPLTISFDPDDAN